MADPRELARWLTRVEAEYVEMPDLQLTEAEMQRLWNLDADTCAAIVHVLVSRGVLSKTTRHGYLRRPS